MAFIAGFFVLHLMFSNIIATSKLIETAVNITSTYYKHNFATIVVWTQSETQYANEFLNNFCGSVVVSPFFGDNKDEIRVVNAVFEFKQIIFFATDIDEYGNFMKFINDIIRFPTLFILVLEETVSEHSELSAFIEVTWNNDQGDLVIISANDAGEIKVSTFNPYSNELCGNYTPVTLKIGENMFPKKYKNFYHCPIRAALLQFEPYVEICRDNGTITSVGGYDGIILMTIINKLNATLEVTSADNHDVYGTYVNGTATGSLNDLASEKADILAPAGILTYKRYTVTLPSHIYHTVVTRWVGPKQRDVFDWLRIVVPDRSNETPVHLVAFSCFIIVGLLIRKRKPHLTNVNNNIIFQSFVLCLGQSVKFVSKSTLLNSLFMLWVWCCYIIRIDYQGDLVEGLQEISLEPPFKSFDDAVTQVDGYGGSEIFLDYYKDTPYEKNYKIVSLTEIQKYIKQILQGERFLLAADLILVRDIKHQIQIINDQISTTGACFFMRPGWPAAEEVDRIIVSLVESGFIENLLSKRKRKIHLKRKRNNVLKPKALGMPTLLTCFLSLVFMWGVCSLVLLAEIVYYNNKIRKINLVNNNKRAY